jgi:tetratricopeptide (TPR) repeat protein
LDNLALLYDRQSHYVDAEPLHLRSLAIFEKTRGPNHPDVAAAFNNLGMLYWKQNRDAEAEPFYRRALTVWERAFGRDHPDVALALNGRYADAEPLYQRSLAVYEKALGRDHPKVALPLNNLAALYNWQARYGDALAIVKRTMANGSANKAVAFPVLMASQTQQLARPREALADS